MKKNYSSILFWTVLFIVIQGGICISPLLALGYYNGKLDACPSTPNCVCSQAKDKTHAVEPITYATTRELAMQKLKEIIQSMPRSEILSETDVYMHVTFSSAVFRFVDDVEFFLDDTGKLIHFRSASRLGILDFGVNRKRMEKIRKTFQ